ncbi:hypothetical protein EBT16_05580 [bacterium]|nr:hypothetical protein [bacterium]
MAILRLISFALGLICSFSFAGQNSVWIIGEKTVSFYSPNQEVQTLEGISAQSSLVDPKTCHLWVQSQEGLLQIFPSLKVQTKTTSKEKILGSEILEDFFITFSDTSWTVRALSGDPVRSFPSLASQPVGLQGNKQIGFWSLQFDREENHLDLIHFDEFGKLLWSKPVSQSAELWSLPKLILIPALDQIWIGFTASSTTHAYSPMVELWTTNGERVKKYPFSDRGLLLDTCTTPNQDFLLARDIPSSPYTVPLFSFIELLSPSEKPKLLYQAFDNYLISSLQCSSDGFWVLQKSVLGGQKPLLVELSGQMQEKIVHSLKEPAWKIHACSLQ